MHTDKNAGGRESLGWATALSSQRLPTRVSRQDSGEEEHVSSVRADRSARHSFYGITLEAGSHHGQGIRRLVKADQRVENQPAIRQMPGGSAMLRHRVETRGCSRWPRAVVKVRLKIRSARASRISLGRRCHSYRHKQGSRRARSSSSNSPPVHRRQQPPNRRTGRSPVKATSC